MTDIFKRMIEISRKYDFDTFIEEDQYVIGGYEVFRSMDDKWVDVCREVNKAFSDVIDKSEYYNKNGYEGGRFCFCIKSDDEEYYFEDITMSFYKKGNLKNAKKILDDLNIPCELKDSYIEIDKSLLKYEDTRVCINIMPEDGDSEGFDAFCYSLVNQGVSTSNIYHLLEAMSPDLKCESLANNSSLYYDKELGYLSKRKTNENLLNLLSINNIDFSEENSEGFLVKKSGDELLKIHIDNSNKYALESNNSDKIFRYEYESELILAIKDIK